MALPLLPADTPAAPPPAGSLRRRSFRDVAWLAAVTWALLTAALLVLVRLEAARTFDASLRERAEVVLAFSQHELEEIAAEGGDTISEELEDSHGGVLLYQVWHADGRLAFRSNAAPRQPLLPAGASGFRDLQVDGLPLRGYAAWNGKRSFQVQMAEEPRTRDALALQGSVLVALVMAATLGLFLHRLGRRLRQTFATLDDTAAELAATPAGRLQPLSAAGKPDELLPMIAAFNDMAARVQRAMQHEQRFTADAAHELKTPLAGMKILLRNAERAPDAPARQQALAQLHQVVDRCAALVDQLLALARYDREPGAFQLDEAVDLAALCTGVLSELQPLARERGVSAHMPPADERLPALHGNREALAVLVRNLVDNALRHGRPGGRVELQVRASADPQGVSLEVHDSGPGIEPALRQRVFGRFVRAGGQGTPGSGLGLAIAERIAQLHGGNVALQASQRLGGTAAVVWLPLRRG
ncbi:MAG: ATP-binding protein [Pseudomonadota bacterium]